MSKYIGDFPDNAIVCLGAFTANAADGSRESFSAGLEEADITIYSDDGDGTWTAMTLEAGTIIITENPGSKVGVYLVCVDMSNDADFATGKDYVAVLYPDETVDSQSVAAVIAHWSCENRSVQTVRGAVASVTAGVSLAADQAVNVTKVNGTAQTAGDLAALITTVDGVADAVKAKTDNLPTDPADESLIQAAIADLKTYVDTEVAAILAAVDTEVAAIKAKTDNLPATPANEGTLTTIASYIDTEVAAILAAVDTEVAAIKAKTDNLPTDPADESLLQAAIADLKTYVDTEVAAIKAKTDLIPTDPADQSAVETAITNAVADLPTNAELATALESCEIVDIDATTANKLADYILRRSYALARASANGDTLAFRSLLGAVAKLVNDVGRDGTDLVIEHEEGTEFGRQTMTADAAADPVVGLETV